MCYKITVLFAIFTLTITLAFQPGLQQFKLPSCGKTSVLLYMVSDSIDLDAIEALGHEASANWDMAATPFLNEKDSLLVKDCLENLADVGYMQVGAIFPDFRRTRFVMTNPDLELDPKEIETQYSRVLCIDIQNSDLPKTGVGSNAWPSLLMRIGVDLENVGDVVVEHNAVYMVVAPEVVKQCKRIIPKELTGVGITISELEYEEYKYISFDGVLQDMELGKLDKRALKYGV